MSNRTWLDSAIFQLFPEWGARRIAKRAALAAFEQRIERLSSGSRGGSESERTRGEKWMVSWLSPDSQIAADLKTVRDRSRDLYRKEPFARGAIEARVANEIGSGLKPQSRVTLAGSDEQTQTHRRKLERLFARWAKRADREGTRSLWTLQRAMNRSWAVDGECFVRFSIDVEDKSRIVPLAIEVIDPSRVETPPGREEDANTRLGITRDANGRPTHYWIRTRAPGDSKYPEEEYEKVPAWDASGLPQVVHLYEQTFPGESRGLPWMEAGLNLLKDIADIAETKLIQQQIAACFAVFVKSDLDSATLAEAAASEVRDGKRIQDLAPGMVHYLNSGEDITFAQPPAAGSDFATFMEWALKRVAAGLNFPYELMTKNWGDLSYSAGRLALIEGRMMFKSHQQLIADTALDPLWQWFVLAAELAQKVDRPEGLSLDEAAEVYWITPGWPWIDPQKEVQANLDAIGGAIETRASVLMSQGVDFEETVEQLKYENERLAAAGIKPDVAALDGSTRKATGPGRPATKDQNTEGAAP